MIDIHAHIWGKNIEGSKRSILDAMDRYEIGRVYVSGLQDLISDVNQIDYLNNCVANFIRENSDRIGGAVYANPKNDNALDVIRAAIEDRGFEMIKLWCCTLADDLSVDPIMAYAEENGIPVLFHAFKKATVQVPNESTGKHIASIARRHPHTKIIMAHFGGNCYDGIPCIRDLQNVWCDHSGTPFHRNEIKYAVENIGAERVLFGTDNAFASNIAQVLAADITDAQKEMIFSENARRILDRNFRI